MATIHDTPPAAVQSDLDSLSSGLDDEIPAKTADNLLIASWNIRSFGSLTRKWTASGSDSPKRDLRGLRALIDILSRFDVIAIQEVKGNLRALRDTLSRRRVGSGTHQGHRGVLSLYPIPPIPLSYTSNDETLSNFCEIRESEHIFTLH